MMDERSAVKPASHTGSFAFFARFIQPADACSDTFAFTEGIFEVVSHATFAADPVEEGRLQDSRNSHGGRGKEDTKRWCGPDEEVL